MRMIHSSEIDGLSIPDRYFSLARSYLDGSRALCEEMVNDDFAPQYSNTRVILHLCRHAVELFFKGAISKTTNSRPPKTHNLASLLAEYERVLPGDHFRFDIPFGVEALGTLEPFPELEARVVDEHQKTLDQRYRYPTDVTGTPFSNPEGFTPTTFLSELMRLSKAFLQVEFQLQGEGS